MVKTNIKKITVFLLSLFFCLFMGSHSAAAQTKLEFLGSFTLPRQTFQNTSVGGISGITYDRQRQKYYLLSDDRSEKAPARFYTATIEFNNSINKIEAVKIEQVTFLKTPEGTDFPAGTIDPEAIALSPQRTLFITSEGISGNGIPAFIREFSLYGGRHLSELPLPDRYLPTNVRDNLGFEAMTIVPSSVGDPFRLFTSTESALLKDRSESGWTRLRLMHYQIEKDQSYLVSEHLYNLDSPPPRGGNGLTALLATVQPGYFFSLERSYIPGDKLSAKIFQIYSGAANDISDFESLSGKLGQIKPVTKELLLDFAQLSIPIDNLEAITFGPKLLDGSQSLIVVSDDNFREQQITQFLFFKLRT